MNRRTWIAGAAALGWLGVASGALAEDVPNGAPQATDIPSLMATAADTKADVSAAIRSILLLCQSAGDPQAQNGLIELFKNKFTVQHGLSAQCIGYVKNRSLTERIVPFLGSKNSWERRDAVWILGRDIRHGRKFVPQLLAALKDDDWDVDMFAAWALGRYQAKEALPLLRTLAKTKKGYRDGEEARLAIEAIEHGPYRPPIAAPAPWLVVPDVDVPEQMLTIGTIITMKGGRETGDFTFGVYRFVSQEGRPPIMVSVMGDQPWFLVFYGGDGIITDVWTKTTVTVGGPYHRLAK